MSIPIRGIGREVDLLGGPERCFGLLVHPPNIVVVDGKEDKAMRVCWEQWFDFEMAFNLGSLVL
jgi:hypothetical protein